MKNQMVNVMLALLVMVIGLAGCGGGGGTAATPTPTGTTVNLTTVKRLYAGTAATGSQMSFTLTGSDTSGNAYNGSFAVVSDGTTTFENQNVTKARVILTLTRTATGDSATNIDTQYFLVSNGNFYKAVDSSGVTSVPSAQTPIADNVHVGDSGHLWDVIDSDGESGSTTWKSEADFNGNSKFTFSSVFKNSSNVITGLLDNTFYLDSTGNPYKYALTITIPSSGTTPATSITISGNRSDVTPGAAVGTEVWVGSNGQGSTNTTLTKNTDGTITTTGQWTYLYQGTTVTCQISAGNAAITGNNITITGSGTATNPAAPAGYQTSPFTLSISGTMGGGQGSGTFTITFQAAGWPAPISGTWTAQKQSGSGVTSTAPATSTTPVAGDWTATTDFGKLIFTVDNTGTKITKMNYQFSNWKCGNVTQSGGTTVSSNWLITNGVFLITTSFDLAGKLTMDFGGTYNSASNKFSGTWNEVSYGTNCSGAWEASAPN